MHNKKCVRFEDSKCSHKHCAWKWYIALDPQEELCIIISKICRSSLLVMYKK